MGTNFDAILTKNDRLIAELAELKRLNETEMVRYHQIQNLPFLSFRRQFSAPSTEVSFQNINDDEIGLSIRKAQERAAKVIQRAWRKNQEIRKCRAIDYRWRNVTPAKTIEFIEVISKKVHKTAAPIKFDLQLWKDRFDRFEKNRLHRATIYAKREKLIHTLEAEQFFSTGNATDASHLQTLAPYLQRKADRDLRTILTEIEDESLIR